MPFGCGSIRHRHNASKCNQSCARTRYRLAPVALAHSLLMLPHQTLLPRRSAAPAQSNMAQSLSPHRSAAAAQSKISHSQISNKNKAKKRDKEPLTMTRPGWSLESSATVSLTRSSAVTLEPLTCYAQGKAQCVHLPCHVCGVAVPDRELTTSLSPHRRNSAARARPMPAGCLANINGGVVL